jgi:hypothetical protein
MLISKPPAASVTTKATTAYPTGDYAVWLAGGLLCPSCKHELRAADIDADDDRVRLICRHCHVDLIIVERN